MKKIRKLLCICFRTFAHLFGVECISATFGGKEEEGGRFASSCLGQNLNNIFISFNNLWNIIWTMLHQQKIFFASLDHNQEIQPGRASKQENLCWSCTKNIDIYVSIYVSLKKNINLQSYYGIDNISMVTHILRQKTHALHMI